jgi:hypothetical protein
MNSQLSWDLFILVFFAIVIAYSYIIGRKDTLKIIIASYIAILTSDGLGNIFDKFIGHSAFFTKLSGFIGLAGGAEGFTPILKILFFISIIVLLTIFGDYDVENPKDHHPFLTIFIMTMMSVMSGGLILSTIIVFANGGSLISGTAPVSIAFQEIYLQSRFVRILLDWHDIWFAMPGALFVFVSVIQKNKAS